MTSLGKKVLALGDPSITAKFQYICGIRSHHGVHSKCNGVNGNSVPDDVTGNGRTGGLNGTVSVSSNGCDSSEKIGVNGHQDHHCNGVKLNAHLSNGFLRERNNLHHKNGYKTPVNGFTKDLQTLTAHDVADNHNQESNGHGANVQSNGHAVGSASTEHAVPYTIENTFLYYVFSFGASLGNEIFYILFFSTTLWNFDSIVVRKMLIPWCVLMYVGQAAKDIIRWPRPTSPPAVHLEERYELEYGMPSTHAMVGVVIPFGMLIYMTDRYEFHLLSGILFCIAWSILVSFSRLYLGMHSALDIIAGLVSAVFLMVLILPFVDPIDTFLISHPYGLVVMVAGCIALGLLYPPIDKWSTARGDTTLVLAVFSGIFAGMWLTGKTTDYIPPPENPPYILALPTAHNLGLALLRQVIGVSCVWSLLTILKVVLLRSLCWLFGYDPKDPKSKQHLHVELPYKYVCYFTSSAVATYLMPLLFLKLNIERPSLYSEILHNSIK